MLSSIISSLPLIIAGFSGIVGLCIAILWNFLKPSRIPNVPFLKDTSFLGYTAFLGNIKMHEIVLALAKQYPRYYQIRLLGQRVLMVHDKHLVKTLFRDVTDKGAPFSRGFIPQNPPNILSIETNDEWRSRRAKFRHPFSSTVLKRFDSDIEALVNKLCNLIDKLISKGEPILMDKLFGELTMDVICRIAFSFELNALDESQLFIDVFENVKTFLKYAIVPTFLPFIGYLKPFRSFSPFLNSYFGADEQLDSFCSNILSHLRCLHAKASLSSDSLGYAFLEFSDQPGITDADVKSEILIAFLAGHETTAHTLSWILFAMCKHPDVQLKAQSAVDNAVGEGAEGGLPDYVEAVIKESMRKFPSVSGSARRVTNEKGYDIDGVHLSKGDWVNMNSFVVQNLSSNWGAEVDVFSPERWLPSEEGNALASAAAYGGTGETKDEMSFFPFAAGPRNCLGMHLAMFEVRATIVQLLRKYSFSFIDEKYRDERFSLERAVTLRPKDDLPLYVVHRL